VVREFYADWIEKVPPIYALLRRLNYVLQPLLFYVQSNLEPVNKDLLHECLALSDFAHIFLLWMCPADLCWRFVVVHINWFGIRRFFLTNCEL
jgi:hypothetical protein